MQREEPAASRQNKLRIGRDEARIWSAGPKAGKPGKFKPCPRCGAEGATAREMDVVGQLLRAEAVHARPLPGVRLLLQRQDGRSNAVPAVLFVAVPLLGILGILGGIVYVLFQRGYASFWNRWDTDEHGSGQIYTDQTGENSLCLIREDPSIPGSSVSHLSSDAYNSSAPPPSHLVPLRGRLRP